MLFIVIHQKDYKDRLHISPRHIRTPIKVQPLVHGMEVSTEKNKIMTNSTCDISADTGMNGQKLEEVTSFKYL